MSRTKRQQRKHRERERRRKAGVLGRKGHARIRRNREIRESLERGR